MGPRVPPRPELLNEGFGLCKTSLELEFGFDVEEFECGGDGVGIEVEGGCSRVVEVPVEAGNGEYRSTVVGSDGLWKVTRPVS